MHSLPKTLPAFFWHFIKQQWKQFLVIQILCFAWSVDHTFWPYILMLVVDAINGIESDRSQMWSVLTVPISLGISLWIGVELAFRISGMMMARVFPKLEASVRMQMFDYIQRHSLLYFGKNLAGRIANKISDMPQSISRVLQLLLTLFIPVLMALIIAVMLFAKLQPWFALILGVWVISHLLFSLAFARKCAHYSDVHAEARSTLTGKVVDSISNNINVKLFANYRFEKQYLEMYQRDEQNKHRKSLWYMEKMKLVLGVLCFIGAGVILNWYMLYSWQQGRITTGEVVFIFNTAWNMMMMAWLVGLELPNLFKEIGVCQQALSVIRDAHDVTDEPDANSLKVTKGEITFDKVTFQYLPGINIFQDKTITLNPGEKVGLVGFSGSGKTTFVNLILRYFDVENGRILIDNQDIFRIKQDSLREQIAMIPQDPTLFHRSLMENIRYGRLDATDDEVIEASKKAHCHEFVTKMPEGYEALVGERGVKLSGGQRQRIAVARAILKNAPILILDEATSALDSVTEKHIQEGLEHVMKGRTTIVIAHRLSTLSDMNRILVFKDGQIVEDGSHEELLQMQGHYAHMWAMQAGGFLPDVQEE